MKKIIFTIFAIVFTTLPINAQYYIHRHNGNTQNTSSKNIAFTPSADGKSWTISGVDVSEIDSISTATRNNSSTITSADQKKKLESIGREFLKYFSAPYVKNVIDLGKYFDKTYTGDKYDYNAVTGRFDECTDALSQVFSAVESVGNGALSTYRSEAKLYEATKYTGHFTANTSTKKWEYTAADDLEFTFPDEQGNTCVAKLTTGGSKKLMKDSESGNEVNIPEYIYVTFTQGETTLLSFTLHLDLSNVTGTEIDLSKDRYSITETLTINDYSWILSKLDYNTSYVSMKFSMLKGSQSLIEVSLNGEGSVTNSGYQIDKFDIGYTYVKVDILGKMQLKGVCSNVKALIDDIQNANDNDDNEATYKSYINQANSLLDFGLYYGDEVRQATFQLEVFEDHYSYWNQTTYWTNNPVIYFDDATSYSVFSSFFDKDSFKTLIDEFNQLVEDYHTMTE